MKGNNIAGLCCGGEEIKGLKIPGSCCSVVDNDHSKTLHYQWD